MVHITTLPYARGFGRAGAGLMLWIVAATMLAGCTGVSQQAKTPFPAAVQNVGDRPQAGYRTYLDMLHY